MTRRALVAAIGAMAAITPAADARDIDVTTTFDARVDDGKCSLREAISSANGDAALFSSPGECPAGTGADTVVLAPGSYDRSAGGADDDNIVGDLDVAGTLTISGAGAALSTIDAKGLDRVLDVLPGATVTIKGVTITGGHASDGSNGGAVTGSDGSPGADATGGSGTPGQAGGGIRSVGVLEITDSAITGNHAGKGGNGSLGTGGNGDLGTSGAAGGDGDGGVGGNGGNGGGIWSSGALTLTRTVVNDNHAGDGGNGGNGQGGMGGLGTAGTGGHGGFGTGGLGGFGGDGGGVFATGPATIDLVTIRANAAGASGSGGKGLGGLGGVAGPNPGTGGTGGDSIGGVAEQGGSNGGLRASGTPVVTRSLIDDNAGGQGGKGGAAAGGKGGAATNGAGGHGGDALARDGGGGGSGAVSMATGTVSDTTITGNQSGAGGDGGSATGGDGGAGSAGAGAGDDATGGNGAAGGDAAAIGAHNTTIVHVTITGNILAAPGIGGGATRGSGSSFGNASPGHSGGPGTGGAVYPTGTTTLRNSIIATNTAPACANDFTDLGNNISFNDASCPGTNVDPLLGPLEDNGGPTLTRRPATESPARDAVPAGGAGCTSTDQRGAARPFGVGCEIGAYEVAAPIALMTQAAPTVAGTVNPSARTTTVHFEFGTTTQYGSSTADIAVPAGVEAVPVTAELSSLAASTTYHVRLVATNADGTGTSDDAAFTTSAQGGGGGGGDTTAPVILSASVKPKTFKRRRGTTFRYKLSEAAKVAFTIQRKKGKRHVKATKFSKTSKAGANKRKFVTRKLKPGRYRATLVATDAANNRSKAKRLTFRIKR